jgi:hypothetical protein
MAALTPVPFATQKGGDGYTQNQNETLVNMFAVVPVSGRTGIIRRQRPCLRSVYAVTGEKRCIERFKGVHYCVIGSGFYSFDGTTLTSLGTLSSSSGRCTMIFNDLNEIMISDGINGYYWNGATLAAVTVPGGMNVGTLTYLGGYGVANDAGTGKFYSTTANNFSAFAALDFATAESNPDPLLRVFADHGELWLAGERNIEIWQLSGSVDFPFLAVPSATIQRGTAAPYSFAREDNTVIWLGDDLVVYRGDGFRPNGISTEVVEDAIKKCTAPGIANAYAMLYGLGKQKFYVLTIPGELSVQYNFATGLWNVCKTYGSNSWDVIGSAGGYSDYYLTAAGICDLTPDVNKDEGNPCVRVAQSAPADAGGARITIQELFADCEVGFAAAGVTAEIMMRVARDSVTFGNIRTRSLGTIGNYQTRAVFRGLGQGRKPVIELSASGDFRWAIMDVLVNATIANS